MNRKSTIAALILAAGAATTGGLACAMISMAEDDASADLAKARITLTQAVGAAEAHASGKATKAELEGERGTLIFLVEVVTADNKVFDVKVDATDGKVLSSQQDQADRGERDDD